MSDYTTFANNASGKERTKVIVKAIEGANEMQREEAGLPKLKPTNDGIYPRCVWCNGENHGPSVIAYSKGKANCYQCHKFIPEEYVR